MKNSIKREQSKLVCSAERENFRLKGKKIFLAAAALCCIAMAAMMTACTDYDDNPAMQGKTVHLRMKVNAGDEAATTRSHFYPTTGVVEFTDGDVIYVASSGRYIGKLTMKDDLFEGDILEPTVGEFLHVFFFGNKNMGDLYLGDADCMMKIIDQSDALPFVAFGLTLMPYAGPDESYVSVLMHQCALVKVEFYNPTDEEVTLHGMKTTALIDFSDPDEPVVARKTRGDIKMNAYDKCVRYALVLPQDSMPEAKMSVGDKEYTISLPTIEAGNIYQIFKYGDEAGYGKFTVTGGTKTNNNDSYDKLFDGRLDTKWYVHKNKRQNGAWFVEFNSRLPFMPTGYTLYTADDSYKNLRRNPKDWRLMAKAKQDDEWTVIATVTDDQKMEDRQSQPYDFPLNVTGQVWQYFRFEVSDNHGDVYMQLGEMELKYDDEEPEVTDPGKVTVMNYPEGANRKSDKGVFTTPWEMFDGDLNTSWSFYCMDYNTYKPINPVYVDFCYEHGFVPTSYSIACEKTYGPRQWKLMGKEKETDDWILLDEKTEQEEVHESKSGVWVPFTFDITSTIKKCRFYRIEFKPGNGYMSIAELKIDSKPKNNEPEAHDPGGFTATGGTSTSDGKGKNWNTLIDGDPNTIWSILDADARYHCYVEFHSNNPFIPTGYTLHNDGENYSPKSWKLMAKAKASDAQWTTIAEETNSDAMHGYNLSKTFPLAVKGREWQYFRFEVGDSYGKAYSGAYVELRDLTFTY